MNRRWTVIFGVVFFTTIVSAHWAGRASAHVLKIDGDIGAVLHINPDDNPVSGVSTDYVVSFDDDSGRFSLKKCDCRVTVLLGSQTMAAKPLAGSGTVSDNHYTFTKPGVYDLRVSGTPREGGTFQPFELDYEVRVSNGQAGTQPMPVLLWAGLALGVGLILLAAYAMEYNGSTQEGI